MELSEQDKKDIAACEEEVIASLKKYGCVLNGAAVIQQGRADVQVLVGKELPPPEEPAKAKK